MICLYNEKEYTDNFIQSMEFSEKSRELARVLLKSRKDCNIFYIKFLGRNENYFDDLWDYRESKLSTSIVKDEEFYAIDIFDLDKTFLESVFMQPLNSIELKLIVGSILNNVITYNDLYNKFKKYPNVNILKHVL